MRGAWEIERQTDRHTCIWRGQEKLCGKCKKTTTQFISICFHKSFYERTSFSLSRLKEWFFFLYCKRNTDVLSSLIETCKLFSLSAVLTGLFCLWCSLVKTFFIYKKKSVIGFRRVKLRFLERPRVSLWFHPVAMTRECERAVLI